MLKRVSLVVINVFFSVWLSGCGNGGAVNAKAPIDPDGYGAVQGGAVSYTGAFLDFYTPAALQAAVMTNPVFTSKLGGFNQFGVCYGLKSDTLGQNLCASNLQAISHNPSFATIFPASGAIDITNFVVAGATALDIALIQPFRIKYRSTGAPYQFAGGANNPQIVSAAVFVPKLASGEPIPASKIKGVLLYFHPTVLSKGGVPSDFDGDLTPNNDATAIQANAITALAEDVILAAIYATQGYIVVVPDYIGQGANWQEQHPYILFPQANAQTGLDALKATRTALSAINISLPNPANLYISSYSEGGSYALWASKLAQSTYADFLSNNGFRLRRTVGVSGAYDLTGATLNFGFANANNSPDPTINLWNISPGLITPPPFATDPQVLAGAKATAAIDLAVAKTSLSGYVLTALAYYNSSFAALAVLAPTYSQMKTCLDWMVTTATGSYPSNGNIVPQLAYVSCLLPYDLAALYNTPGLTQSQIANQSFAAATAYPIGTNEFLVGGKTFKALTDSLAFGYTNNSIGSFIQPGVMNDPAITPFFSRGNIQSWVTTSPIDILFLNYDSTVSNINSLEACGDLSSGAFFPGHQPGYVGGVKQLSAPGMVQCTNLANNGLGQLPQLYTQSGSQVIMIDHGYAEAVLQILALNQIMANP